MITRRSPLTSIFTISMLLLASLLSGCSYLSPVSYYDPTTYQNLTELKPEILMLYDSFSGDTVDYDQINAIRLKLSQVYEYEKGKGEKNEETYKQVNIIQKMFERHVKDRIDNGPWNASHLDNRKQNISDAFDISIKTERSKNKNE